MTDSAFPPPPPPTPPSVAPAGWAPPMAPTWSAAPRSSRRWTWVAVAGLCGLLVVAFFVVGRQTSSPSTTSATGTSFTDPTSHFRATYQHTPVEDDQSTSVGAEPINEVLWTDTIDRNTAEIVGYASFPADFSFAAPNAALDGSVTGEVSNIHGTLMSKNFGTYQGFRSVDAVISAAGGYVETRAVLAGRTLYLVVVTSLNNPPELFSGFANSLQILNHAG